MPHPKRIVKPKIPRFSQLVGSDTPALQSPIVSENRRPDRLAAPEKEPFNARVAAYTFAFVGVMLGGLFVGVKSKEITERRQQRKEYEDMSIDGKIEDLKKFRAKLMEQREKIEDQVVLIRMKSESTSRDASG